MRYLLGVLGFCFAVSACATPQPIFVGDLTYNAEAEPVAATYSVTVAQSALSEDHHTSVYNEWQYVTSVTEPHISEIVRDDLEQILQAHTAPQGVQEDSMHIEVEILSADVAYRHSVAELAPFVGLATAARQRDFRTEFEIELTVLDGGRALRSTRYTPVVFTRGNSATRATIAQGVELGVQSLRQELVSTFVEDVIVRYVWE